MRLHWIHFLNQLLNCFNKINLNAHLSACFHDCAITNRTMQKKSTKLNTLKKSRLRKGECTVYTTQLLWNIHLCTEMPWHKYFYKTFTHCPLTNSSTRHAHRTNFAQTKNHSHKFIISIIYRIKHELCLTWHIQCSQTKTEILANKIGSKTFNRFFCSLNK